MCCYVDREMSELGDLCASLRYFLEPKWKEWKASTSSPMDALDTLSSGMCGFSSIFVVEALNRLTDDQWEFVGGQPVSGGGVICRAGKQNGHFWALSDRGVIVDLTADQFGLPAVVVTMAGDPRYNATFDQVQIDAHVPRVEEVGAMWLEEAIYDGLVPNSMAFAA